MNRFIKLFSVAGLVLSSIVANATVRYVTSSGTGDGSSWAKASGDLQAMIDASSSGDEVWVKAGTYKPKQLIDAKRKRSYSFILKSGVSLYGGFDGTETSKDERKLKEGGKKYEYANETILSADDDVPDVWTREFEAGSSSRYSWTITGNKGNNNHVLYNKTGLTDKTEVSGFTMKGAFADVYQVYAGGAAIYAKGWLEVRDCTFKENASHFKAESSKDYYGGAVAILPTEGIEGKAVVEDCLFENNFTRSSYGNSFGGGLYIDGGTVNGCTFKGCVSLDNGGGLYSEGASVENCTFDDCYAAAGGGLYNNNGTASIITAQNCRAIKGGAVYNNGSLSYAKIVNCYGDSEDYSYLGGGEGGGVYNESGRILGSVITNCSAYNGGGICLKGGYVVNSTVQHNFARNTETVSAPNIYQSTDNSEAVLNTIGNPDAEASNFVKPSSFIGWSTDEAKKNEAIEASWQLAEGSSFIDKGTATAGVSETVDIAGNPRVSGSSIDVGAYEYVTTDKTPNMVLTFETNSSVRFGTGGEADAQFFIDWGDGTLTEYTGQQYVTGTPTNKVVKIYGDGLVLLRAINAGLTAVDISNAPSLIQVQVGQNKLTSLDVTNNTSLTGLYCEENQIETLDVSKLANLKVLDCHDNNLSGTLDCSVMTNLSKVDCSINSLSEVLIPAAPNLIDILCEHNKIASIDVSKATGLEQLECNDNLLTTIDLSKNTKLKELYCPANKLNSLDVSNNTALTTLTAFENELTSIDVSNNTALTGLYLQDNKLSSLDISKNTALQWVAVSNNNIDRLDLSNLTSLTSLIVSKNNLTELDITKNPKIFRLEADNNNLKEIDVKNQSNLSTFSIANNKITSLDLSKNPYLYWLICNNNELTALDLTSNTYVQKLIANDNSIKTLDLSKNKSLQGVMLQGNEMYATAINTIISVLPDVSKLEVTDDNRDWMRQFNISDMPGTQDAKVADAESKGWFVTASGGGTNGLESIETKESALVYNPADATISASVRMNITVFAQSGQKVKSASDVLQMEVAELPSGVYFIQATDSTGRVYALKFVR